MSHHPRVITLGLERIERLLLLLEAVGLAFPDPAPDAYAVVPDPDALPRVMPVLRALRRAGARVQMHAGGPEGMGSMKSQFKKADASGARFALIFGPDEVAQGQVSVKPLRAVDGQVAAQRTEALADAAQWAASLR